ncbi:hypothetical protein PT015_00330 [Candidatus Mycobacterium wuenschmannii]|uniref:Uncharacterized protein n=1 Tax=Candidatus Mycobacterium wuenschmannii TaxID=3027808 RepID=A0ABY8VZ03_9MYCO|nr:hypothetical protein [Candidatus Mycobacterium wuenschmannii]WIM88019.1 hypothetical protein PT015_00330 [Candidatus Mycobacterium wuenschmannii]
MTRRVGSRAAVVGAIGAAALGAALINSPLADATTDPPPVPSLLDFGPPGSEGYPTTIEASSIPFIYNFEDQTVPYSISENATTVGTYDTHEVGGVVGLLPFLALTENSAVVTDSTGLAPTVGTEWNGVAFGSGALPGPAQLAFIDSYMSSPDGSSANIFELFGQIGDYFSTGPTGTVFEVDIFNTWLPIFDTQAVTAMSTGLDAIGAGGMTDLSALAAEFSTLF